MTRSFLCSLVVVVVVSLVSLAESGPAYPGYMTEDHDRYDHLDKMVYDDGFDRGHHLMGLIHEMEGPGMGYYGNLISRRRRSLPDDVNQHLPVEPAHPFFGKSYNGLQLNPYYFYSQHPQYYKRNNYYGGGGGGYGMGGYGGGGGYPAPYY